jgi:hypothetical protein
MAQIQVPVRLPDDIVKRLDKHIERMQQAEPGLEFTRADAVRTLVVRGLEIVEKGGKR